MLKLDRKRKLRHFAETEPATLQDLKSKTQGEQDLFEAYYSLMILGLKEDVHDEAVWKELTRPQQVLATLGLFVSQVNNGGVWQFLFNRREFALVTGEALDEVFRISALSSEYTAVLREFATMNRDGRWQTLMDKLREVEPTSPEAWKIFVEGEKDLPHSQAFNEIFFDPKKRIRMFSALNRYIEQNLDKLLKIESIQKKSLAGEKSPKPGPAEPVKKKDAISYFSKYLEEQYKTAPEEVSIYYTARVTIDSQPTQLFLMRYRMPKGFESVGVTGHFTLHFPKLTFAEVSKMHQQHHKQKLVNAYYGAYLVEKTLADDRSAADMEPGLWDSFLRTVQSPTNDQIPVNVTFQDYLKMTDYEIVVYSGDLLYARSGTEPPKNPQKVSTDPKDGFAGETNLVFHANPRGQSFGGRARKGDPLDGAYRLFASVGSKFKLLKDNPWGR